MTSYQAAPRVEITSSDHSITSSAGIVLTSTVLDRLQVEELIDQRLALFVRQRGYSEGELARTIIDMLLCGGDFCSDVALLSGATAALRGRDVPAACTLTRFLGRATPGTPSALNAVLEESLRRAWHAGAAPEGDAITLDVDSSLVPVHGATKQGAARAYNSELAYNPLMATVGETGEAVALRLRKGSAYVARGAGDFVARAAAAVRRADPQGRDVHVRADSGFYTKAVVEGCIRAEATFSIAARPSLVRKAIYATATSPDIAWEDAIDMVGAQVCSVPYHFRGHDLRLIIRRVPKLPTAQLAFDDLDGYAYHAILSNDPRPAPELEHHHRLRGGVCEETIRQLKEGFGLAHLPVGSFFGNWVWAQLACLAHNIAQWTRTLGLPRDQRRMRVKRFRRMWINVAARIVRTGRRIVLRLAADHPDPDGFVAAYALLRALPAFG